MKRIVQPELLDSLPPDDPRALRSRRDLHRLNAWMRHHAIMAGLLQKALNPRAPGPITELGAGDGNFLLRVAKKIPHRCTDVAVTLLDRQKSVSPATLAGFAAIGWHAETMIADVFDWPRTSPADGIVIANLFLHHFEDARLGKLLNLISQRAALFIALEPTRAPWTLLGSRLLWAAGFNEVTQHDAAASVRAGFSGHELSAFWPDRQRWRLTERSGLSHLFIAQKIN